MKRPPWLLAALVVSLVFGAMSWNEGCSRIEFYRGTQAIDAVVDSQVQDAEARASIQDMYDRFGTIADESRNVVLPFAVGTFVIGAALLALSARGLAGRTNTRSVLVQLVAVQAIVACASFAATRRFRDAELEWDSTQKIALQKTMALPDETFRQRARIIDGARRWGPPIGIVFRMLGSGLVLLALTRQKSRAFFEAAGAHVPEP